jgi:predicted nuclease of predicted toxin-antitoxin system
MRILLDECLPKQLKRELRGHTVAMVTEMGWSGIKNGALLDLAEPHFDVFMTVDRGMPHQQNIGTRNIALVLFRAKSNSIQSLRPLIPDAERALSQVNVGEVMRIGSWDEER